MKFNIENHSTLSRAAIEEDVTTAYNEIMGAVEGDYHPVSPMTIELYNKLDVSVTSRDRVVLYKDKGHFLTVHELSHALLWGAEEESSDRGYCTQEGLAIHLQTEYGDPVYPNYEASPHELMNVLNDEGIAIPITKLCGTSMSRMLFQPSLESDDASRSLQWISYIESASFVSYLIEEYGMDNFEKVFNQKNVLQRMKEVFGKGAEELESEWLGYVAKKEFELNKKEQEQVPGLKKRMNDVGEIDERYLR